MKKSLRDRALALLLAMTMVVGMLPTAALAADPGAGGGTTGATVNHPPNATPTTSMTFNSGYEFLRVTVVRVPINSDFGDLVDGTPSDAEMKAEFDLMKLSAIKASGYESWTLDFPTKGSTANFASTSTRWALTNALGYAVQISNNDLFCLKVKSSIEQMLYFFPGCAMISYTIPKRGGGRPG